MKKTIIIRNLILSSFALLVFINSISAAPVVREAAGANPAAIQAAVDQFRADLGGGTTAGANGSFGGIRREINWDGVPDAFSAPGNLPFDFFNVNSPRGVIFSSTSAFVTLAGPRQLFQVSANSASGTAVNFGNLDPSYTATFQTFSAQRLFTVGGGDSNILEINFFIPGTKIPATVSGFGAVFTDVDTSSTRMNFYDAGGQRMPEPNLSVLAANNGLSFKGVSYNAGERIARVVIVLGNAPLKNGNVDNNGSVDVVAMDDFIYGEPRATEHHQSDFDGDGTADLAVFRPSIGTWFILNSGSNTFNGVQFGANGDVPVDGDFDGDSRSDFAVFRPSNGVWFILNSSNGAFSGVQFGANGDKPVAGDYDKDGKTDVAVWRPSVGSYFILRSSNGAFQAAQFGQNGDIPIGSALNP